MIRLLAIIAAVGLCGLLGGCDPLDHASVSASLRQPLSRAQVIFDIEAVARDAHLTRIHDWDCEEARKSPDCPPGSSLEAWYQGRGQTIVFNQSGQKLVFSFSAMPGRAAPPTRDDLVAIWKALADRFGADQVEICHLDRCNRSGHWPRRTWFSQV